MMTDIYQYVPLGRSPHAALLQSVAPELTEYSHSTSQLTAPMWAVVLAKVIARNLRVHGAGGARWRGNSAQHGVVIRGPRELLTSALDRCRRDTGSLEYLLTLLLIVANDPEAQADGSDLTLVHEFCERRPTRAIRCVCAQQFVWPDVYNAHVSACSAHQADVAARRRVRGAATGSVNQPT